MTAIGRALTIARDVRAQLLRYEECARDPAGQCGLAAMLVATAIDDPHAVRTGFYMQFEQLFGTRGRCPHRHAWCRVGPTIVDLTATQFDRRNRAVLVARHDEDPRYIETARGLAAIEDIMTNWRGRALPAYAHLATSMRKRCRSTKGPS